MDSEPLANENKKIETKKQEKKYTCLICSKSFEWNSGLSRHKKLFHTQNIPNISYKCKICGQCFTKQVGLSVHLKLHEKIGETRNRVKHKISKIYGKVVSETVYSSDSDCEYEVLQTVVKIRPDKGDKKCEVCGKNFVRQQSLKRHLNKHNKPTETQIVNDQILTATHACDKCNKTFKNACNLSNHLKLHLKESLVTKKLELNRSKVLFAKTTYPCNLCSRVYLKQSHLQNHLILHESASENSRKTIQDKLYLCMICGKRYSRSSHLSLHMRTHVDFKPHLCSVCGNF